MTKRQNNMVGAKAVHFWLSKPTIIRWSIFKARWFKSLITITIWNFESKWFFGKNWVKSQRSVLCRLFCRKDINYNKIFSTFQFQNICILCFHVKFFFLPTNSTRDLHRALTIFPKHSTVDHKSRPVWATNYGWCITGLIEVTTNHSRPPPTVISGPYRSGAG